MAALMAAREVKKISMLAKLTSSFSDMPEIN